MGLFDKFRKKVQDAAAEADTDSLSAEEGSEEALAAIDHQQKSISPIQEEPEEDWEEFDEDEELQLPDTQDDEWDEWDEDETYTLPTKLTRREKKILAKNAKKENKK